MYIIATIPGYKWCFYGRSAGRSEAQAKSIVAFLFRSEGLKASDVHTEVVDRIPPGMTVW